MIKKLAMKRVTMKINPSGSIEWEDMLFEKEDISNVFPLEDEDVIILSGDYPFSRNIAKGASKVINRRLPFYIVNILDDDD